MNCGWQPQVSSEADEEQSSVLPFSLSLPNDVMAKPQHGQHEGSCHHVEKELGAQLDGNCPCWDGQKPPQEECCETQDAAEAPGSWGKNLNLSGPPALGSACRPLLRDVLEMHLLEAQVRLIQKTGGGPPDPLVRVGRSPGAGLVSLPKAQPQA
ncbi:hypothetical protein CB1_000204023 [Camelus ferus]|nr:hypothetical protein CB1_000204023 [Camelus ferus]